MWVENLSLGKKGEEAAVPFLKENGYKILYRNYKSKLGEIDIIAQDKDTICFVEVKTRRDNKFGLPSEAVDKFKQRQITKTALVFLKEKKLLDKKARFDVVAAICSKDELKFSLIKNAFELDISFSY
ncbi:MAG: YraN family protein [Candidatus Omnitrophica bacterium]|nr:YraN family protein [Candidatus Omnitrophota bacterium]